MMVQTKRIEGVKRHQGLCGMNKPAASEAEILIDQCLVMPMCSRQCSSYYPYNIIHLKSANQS